VIIDMLSTRRSAKQNLFTILSLGIGSLLVVALFMIKPLAGQLGDFHQQLEDQKSLYKKLIMEETSYRTAQSDFAKIKDGVDEIRSLFPPREQLVKNIESLEAAAAQFESEFSLSITDVKEDESIQNSKNAFVPPPYDIVPGLVNIEVIPYIFDVEGSFLGTVKFLQVLEHQPFYSEIESLSLMGVSSAASSGQGQQQKLQRSGQVQAKFTAAFYADQAEDPNNNK